MLTEPVENQYTPPTTEYLWPSQFERPSLQEVIEHYEPIADQNISFNMDRLAQRIKYTNEKVSRIEKAPRIIDASIQDQYIDSIRNLLPALNSLCVNDKFLNYIASLKEDPPTFEEVQGGLKNVYPEMKDDDVKRVAFILRYNCDPLMMRINADTLTKAGQLTPTEQLLAKSLTHEDDVLEAYFNYYTNGGERNFVVGGPPGSGMSEKSFDHLLKKWVEAVRVIDATIPQEEIIQSINQWFDAPGDIHDPQYEKANVFKIGYGNVDGIFILDGETRNIGKNISHGSCIAEDIKRYATRVEQGMYFGSVLKKVLSLWETHFPQIKVDKFPTKWDMQFRQDIIDEARNLGKPINPFELDNGMWNQKARKIDLMIGKNLEKSGNEMFFEKITDRNKITAKRIINDIRKVSHELAHMWLGDLAFKDIDQLPPPTTEQVASITPDDIQYGPYSALHEGLSILMEELTLSALVSDPNQIGCDFSDSKFITDQIIVRRKDLEKALDIYTRINDYSLLPEMPYAEGFLKIVWPLFVHNAIGLDEKYSYSKGLDGVVTFISSLDTAKIFLLPRSDETYVKLISINDTESTEWQTTFAAFRAKIIKNVSV